MLEFPTGFKMSLTFAGGLYVSVLTAFYVRRFLASRWHTHNRKTSRR